MHRLSITFLIFSTLSVLVSAVPVGSSFDSTTPALINSDRAATNLHFARTQEEGGPPDDVLGAETPGSLKSSRRKSVSFSPDIPHVDKYAMDRESWTVTLGRIRMTYPLLPEPRRVAIQSVLNQFNDMAWECRGRSIIKQAKDFKDAKYRKEHWLEAAEFFSQYDFMPDCQLDLRGSMRLASAIIDNAASSGHVAFPLQVEWSDPAALGALDEAWRGVFIRTTLVLPSLDPASRDYEYVMLRVSPLLETAWNGLPPQVQKGMDRNFQSKVDRTKNWKELSIAISQQLGQLDPFYQTALANPIQELSRALDAIEPARTNPKNGRGAIGST